MAKRRANGDGLMRKRSDGRWEGRIVVGHKENGKPIFKSVFGRTQKELLPKLEQLRRDYAGTDLTEECRMPLGEWLEQWLLEHGQRLRPATVDGYRYCIRLIDQHLAAVPLDQLKKPDVQKMYNALLDSGLSSSTVRSVHMMLHEAMDGLHSTISAVVLGVPMFKLRCLPHKLLQVQVYLMNHFCRVFSLVLIQRLQ